MNYEWLASRMRADGLHFSWRLSAAQLKARHESGHAVVWREVSCGCDVKVKHPIACAFLWETALERCLEVGSVWVRSSWRRKGCASGVIKEAMQLAGADGREFFMITAELSLKATAMSLGFVPITRAVMPSVKRWAIERGLRTRLPESARTDEFPTFVQGERQLFTRSSR